MEPSAERLAGRIVAGAADAVLFTDRAGTIQLWNAGAERIFARRSTRTAPRSVLR